MMNVRRKGELVPDQSLLPPAPPKGDEGLNEKRGAILSQPSVVGQEVRRGQATQNKNGA